MGLIDYSDEQLELPPQQKNAFADFGEYMAAKRAKLAVQYVPSETSLYVGVFLFLNIN